MSYNFVLCNTSMNPKQNTVFILHARSLSKSDQHSWDQTRFFFFFSYSRHLRIDKKALLLMCFQEQLKFIECSFISPLSTDAWRQRWTNTGTTMTRGHTRSHTWGWRWYLQWWHAWCGWQLPRHSQTSANNCEYETLSAPVCRHEARPEQWERQNLHCQHNN